MNADRFLQLVKNLAEAIAASDVSAFSARMVGFLVVDDSEAPWSGAARSSGTFEMGTGLVSPLVVSY